MLPLLALVLAQAATPAPIEATATDEPANVSPLPGQPPCPYPVVAQALAIVGHVPFVVHVAPDGSAQAVDVTRVPAPDVGFEATVRECVARWRFPAAPDGVSAPRRYAGAIRYRLDLEAEKAIRRLLEELAAAWGSGSESAVGALEDRDDDLPFERIRGPFLRDAVIVAGATGSCGLSLDPDLTYLRFLRRDLALVGQRFVCGTDDTSDRRLELVVARSPKGWRFTRLTDTERAYYEAPLVGRAIEEPRKTRQVAPLYPEIARRAGVDGPVVLECRVSEQGKVTAIRVLRPIPLLDQAAIDAVRQWEYEPVTFGGRARPVRVTVTLTFRQR